jgi:hypothetical protein
VGATPFGSRLRFNEHFAADLHTLGRLAVPHKIIKGCPANPMRRAKLRNCERYMVFHGQPCTSISAYCQRAPRRRVSGGTFKANFPNESLKSRLSP